MSKPIDHSLPVHRAGVPQIAAVLRIDHCLSRWIDDQDRWGGVGLHDTEPRRDVEVLLVPTEVDRDDLEVLVQEVMDLMCFQDSGQNPAVGAPVATEVNQQALAVRFGVRQRCVDRRHPIGVNIIWRRYRRIGRLDDLGRRDLGGGRERDGHCGYPPMPLLLGFGRRSNDAGEGYQLRMGSIRECVAENSPEAAAWLNARSENVDVFAIDAKATGSALDAQLFNGDEPRAFEIYEARPVLFDNAARLGVDGNLVEQWIEHVASYATEQYWAAYSGLTDLLMECRPGDDTTFFR